MFYNWRIRRVIREILRLETAQKRINEALADPESGWDWTLLSRGTQIGDARSALVDISERLVTLKKKREKLEAKRFKSKMSRMFKI